LVNVEASIFSIVNIIDSQFRNLLIVKRLMLSFKSDDVQILFYKIIRSCTWRAMDSWPDRNKGWTKQLTLTGYHFLFLDFLGKIYHVLDSLSIVKLLPRYVMNHFKLKEKWSLITRKLLPLIRNYYFCSIDDKRFFLSRAKRELKSLSKRVMVGCNSGFETNQSFLVSKGQTNKININDVFAAKTVFLIFQPLTYKPSIKNSLKKKRTYKKYCSSLGGKVS